MLHANKGQQIIKIYLRSASLYQIQRERFVEYQNLAVQNISMNLLHALKN